MATEAREMNQQVMARARYVRVSAYKARNVLSLIRGKGIDEARRILAFSERSIARDISKVMESAAANAEHNFQMSPEELRVSEAYADEGPTIPRIRPRAQGRAFKIRKRTCHITVIMERDPKRAIDAETQPRRRRPQAGSKPEETVTEAKPKPKRRSTKPKPSDGESKTKSEATTKTKAKPKPKPKPKASAKPKIEQPKEEPAKKAPSKTKKTEAEPEPKAEAEES